MKAEVQTSGGTRLTFGKYAGTVTPVRHRVVVMIYEQEMFYALTHAAAFEDKADAERLARRVEEATKGIKPWTPSPAGTFKGLDLTKWRWDASPCNPWAVLQVPPTAEEYVVPATAV